MNTLLTPPTDLDRYTVRSRKNNQRYLLDLNGMMKITELIDFYNESIYYLPDDVTVRGYTQDDDTYTSVELKVNELIFTR